MFGARPAKPELLLSILEANSSWTDKQISDTAADERARCLELGRATKGVKLVIQTLAAHIVAGVDTITLCQRVQDAITLRTHRGAAQWEREAGEQFDRSPRGTFDHLDEPPDMPDSDDEDYRDNLVGPPMPLTDSDDEAVSTPPPLPQHLVRQLLRLPLRLRRPLLITHYFCSGYLVSYLF